MTDSGSTVRSFDFERFGLELPCRSNYKSMLLHAPCYRFTSARAGNKNLAYPKGISINGHYLAWSVAVLEIQFDQVGNET